MHTHARVRIRAALSAERILSLISATLIGIAALARLGLASPQDVSVAQVVDNSFVEAAVKDLGPYAQQSK